MENIIGTLTMVLAIAMVVIALPSQIRKNLREKKCGLSIWMVLLPLSVYAARAVYTINGSSGFRMFWEWCFPLFF